MTRSEFSNTITKNLTFKKLNPPQTLYFKKFNLYITIFYLPGPSNTKMEKIVEHTCYDDNGNILSNKWFYRVPTKFYI